MSVAEEAYIASQAMLEKALKSARDNLSDVRVSGNQCAIKLAEENIEIALIFSQASIKTAKLTNKFGSKSIETSPCDNCRGSPCLDGQYVRRAGYGFRVLEERSGKVGMVKTKKKKGLMYIKWDSGPVSNGYEIYDPVVGQFLLRFCCRENKRFDGDEEIEGNEDSKLTILAKKCPQIIDVTSPDNENDSTKTYDDQVRILELFNLKFYY